MKLRDVAAAIKTGYHFRTSLYDYPAGDIMVLQSRDLEEKLGIKPLMIDIDARDNNYLRDGDVLLSIRGVFRAACVSLEGRIAIAAASILVIRPRTDFIDPGYLALYFNSDIGQAQLRSIATGASIQALTISKLSDLEIPLPPIEHQRKLAQLDKNIGLQQDMLDKRKLSLDNILRTATRKTIRSNT